jgi:polyketide cyclase/dehydrase/lipid transport protein
MSDCRQQVFIDAPPRIVWELISEVERHPEWWPDVVEVQCDEGVAEGCKYREVIKVPLGTGERNFLIEDFDDARRFHITCVDTGAFVDISLAEARGGCFVDALAGVDPKSLGFKVFDAVAGKRYWRRWLEQSLDAIRKISGERAAA